MVFVQIYGVSSIFAIQLLMYPVKIEGFEGEPWSWMQIKKLKSCTHHTRLDLAEYLEGLIPLDQHEWSQGRKTHSNAIYWVPYFMFDAGNGDSAIST